MALLITEGGVIVAEEIINGIAVNPVNAPVEKIDHCRRTHEEIALWLRRPYVVGRDGAFKVQCLDGKRSDRPSQWETTDNLEDAICYAGMV